MDAQIKSNFRFSGNKVSLVVLAISVILTILLFVKIELVSRTTEAKEAKLEDRIQRIEEELQNKVHKMFEQVYQSNVIPARRQSGEWDPVIWDKAPDYYYRQRRNAAPTPSSLSLQQIRQEIDKKLTQVCSSTDELCQTGPPGPPGVSGTPGYPGYKGEKGAPGKTGPQGPLGRTGVQGDRGKQGPTGPQGLQGAKGEQGSIGSPGQKGDVGQMGPIGQKGLIGLKGNKGSKGLTGVQGPKGKCVVSPKIIVFPKSQSVFINQAATIYCWVQGQTFTKTTWRKLGGVLHGDAVTEGGVLRISNAQKSHAGSYLCTVFNGYGIFREISTLGIKESPVLTRKPPSVLYVNLGSTVRLCCEAKGSLQWSRAGKELTLTPSFQQNGCLTINKIKEESAGKYTCRAANEYGFAESTTELVVTGGSYEINMGSKNVQAYRHMTNDGKEWILIARFSNSDNKNWMRDDGRWWYDQQVAIGTTNNPSINADMISPVFWLLSGNELKITRSDDPIHTPLLQTTGNCLDGQTFRSKITRYGSFRNGKVWSSNKCLGSCTVQYGGQYKTTDGFQQAHCSGSIQSSNKIGFWCDWHSGDGSVMMIGGGGNECARADHGIGITESGEASFIDLNSIEIEYDFGYDAGIMSPPSNSYSLNLWIR